MANSKPGACGENRRSTRFRIGAAVVFSWTSMGELKRAVGITRDLSKSGAFILCGGDCEVHAGQEIRLEGLLPAIVTGAQAIGFHAQGSVARRSTTEEGLGFAVLADIKITEHPTLQVRQAPDNCSLA